MARVLITGATAGIGRVTARHLAARGHLVFASGRREEALRALEAEAPGVVGIPFDVTDEAAIAAARDQIDHRTEGRGVDALVNNAGFGQGGPLEMLSDRDIRAQYETNVFGLLAVTRAFLPRMRERGAGRVVNVGSVAGTVALPFLGAYASTKHAVQGLSDSLRRELKPFGVHVSVVRPGAIRTDFGFGEAEGLRACAGEDSPYRRPLSAFLPWHARLHPTAPEAIHVARAIEHAATARHPRPYYVVPLGNYWLLALQKLAPAVLLDAIVERVIGLPPRVGPND